MPVCPLIPGQDRLAVLADEPLSLTPGGIHIPASAQFATSAIRGVVVAVGGLSPNTIQAIGQGFKPENQTEWGEAAQAACPYKIDDIVYFGKYAGTEVEIGKQKVRIIHVGDVLAKIRTEGS